MSGTVSGVEFFPELQLALSLEFGPRGQIVSITRRPSEYRTSFVLDELDVVLAEGNVLRLLAKNVARTALTDLARLAKPVFLHDPLREIHVYEQILKPEVLGPPRYFGAIVDEAADCFWLFIER